MSLDKTNDWIREILDRQTRIEQKLDLQLSNQHQCKVDCTKDVSHIKAEMDSLKQSDLHVIKTQLNFLWASIATIITALIVNHFTGVIK